MSWLVTLLTILLTFSVCVVAYAYVGYPALIWCAARLYGRADRRPRVDECNLPTVSLVIAAYNEEKHIRQRIENALETDYPASKFEIVIASDGSGDRTNEIVQEYERFGVKLWAFANRRGKASVLNDVIPAVSGDLVMLSDANTFTHASAAQRLAAWFHDSGVGVVCGRLVLTDPRSGRNVDSLYWKYETFLKKCEGRLGALLGSNGAIYAIRKSLYRPIPPNTIVDDFVIPLLARAHSGCRIVYDREAVAVEETPPRLASEFRRRARIGAGGFQSIGLLAGLLHPRHGWVSVAFASHKILRWLCPFALVAAFAANVALAGRPPFDYLLLAQALFYIGSVSAEALPARPRALRFLRLGTMFTMMNAALLVGFVRWLRGAQSAAWSRTDRAGAIGVAPAVTG